MTDYALSLTLAGHTDLPTAVLQALYRITGRSSVELRRSILAGEPVYIAGLFGSDHIDVVPRLEKTIAYLDETGLAYTLQERVDGDTADISLETMRSILEGTGDQPE